MVHEAISNEVKESCTSISLIEYIQYLCDDICIFNVFYTSHICTIHICTSIDKAFVCFPYTFLPFFLEYTMPSFVSAIERNYNAEEPQRNTPSAYNARDNQTVIVGYTSIYTYTALAGVQLKLW